MRQGLERLEEGEGGGGGGGGVVVGGWGGVEVGRGGGGERWRCMCHHAPAADFIHRSCSCGWWLDPLVSTYMLVWRYVILIYVIIKRYYGDMCYYGEWVCWTLFCTLIAP